MSWESFMQEAVGVSPPSAPCGPQCGCGRCQAATSTVGVDKEYAGLARRSSSSRRPSLSHNRRLRLPARTALPVALRANTNGRLHPRAVSLNRQFAQSLGWGASFARIARLLGIAPTPLDEWALAAAIARWQSAHGLTSDGVLGPRTWRVLGRLVGKLNQVLCQPPADLRPDERTALALTSNFETGAPFHCVVSSPADPDGISMGMIQWNLRAGTLQWMIRAFERAGGDLNSHFGPLLPDLRRLLTMWQPRSMKGMTSQGRQNYEREKEAMIEEARRLRRADSTRWNAALLGLCGDPIYCRLQIDDLRRRFRNVWPAVRALGLGTVRGLSMMFDVEVGDGYAARIGDNVVANGKIRRMLERLNGRAASLGRTLTEREKLVEIADEAARFARDLAGERRARRLVIAHGTGVYRRRTWNLAANFPNLDNPLAPH